MNNYMYTASRRRFKLGLNSSRKLDDANTRESNLNTFPSVETRFCNFLIAYFGDISHLKYVKVHVKKHLYIRRHISKYIRKILMQKM